jgi:hypothetical protein
MPPASAGTEARVEMAAQFRRAMDAAAPKLREIIDSVPVPTSGEG